MNPPSQVSLAADVTGAAALLLLGLFPDRLPPVAAVALLLASFTQVTPPQPARGCPN